MAADLPDLDLLRLFEALSQERNVTRAALRLGLTQSAASNALKRLRLAFHDDLFQRTPGGMEPTALARELAGPVGAALDAVREAVALRLPFDPASAVADFTIGLSDYAELVLMPPLVRAVRATAPGVSLVARTVDREQAIPMLDDDRIQLAVGLFPEPPAHMTRIGLLQDDLVAIVRSGHPLASGIDLGAYIAADHLLVSAVGSRTGAVDRALSAIGRQRRLAAVVSHYLVTGPILRDGDLVCTMARRIARPLAEAFGLVVLPMPSGLDLPRQATRLAFHNRYAQRSAHLWLRKLMADVARGLD